LTTSANSASGTTSYSYDGAGNQTGSAGPAGVTTNTYNDLGQLTHVTGPNTSAGYVSDGQGDRLRSLTQGTPQWQIQALAQDLTTGGLSALASDGTNDYAYLQPGDGQAPLAGSNQQTGQTTYLATDLGGSVRVATNAAAQVIGAGAYDAWGNPRPTTPGSAGATQLTGLQGATPFGYAGQYRDAGAGTSAGTYDLRAREYDPATGRFLSVDPLLDQTGQPYLYAGDNPVDNTDPSGQCTIEGINLLNIIGDVSPCSPAQQDSFLTGALRTPVMSDGARPEFSVYTPSRRDIAYLYQQALRIPAAAGLIRAGGNAAHGDHGFRVYGVKGTVLIDDANVPLPGPDSLGDPIRSSRRCGGGTASTAWDAAAQTVQGVQGVQGALDYGAVVVGPTADRPAGALIGVLGRAVAAGVGRLTIGKLLLPVAGIALVKAIPFFIIPTPSTGTTTPPPPSSPPSSDPRDKNGYPIFKEYESKIPYVAKIDYDAIEVHEKPSVLTKTAKNESAQHKASGCLIKPEGVRNYEPRYKNSTEKADRGPHAGELLVSCEEYPFAKSDQGGAGAYIGPVPQGENNDQGGFFSGFTRRNHLKVGDKYAVQVILDVSCGESKVD
jgi:RHS repeat-associated protein